jgi:guanylate kinase
VVLAAPSGTGKTSIARRLVQAHPAFTFSVSATTRPPRARERPGVDYEFVSASEFDRLVSQGELLEWAEVHGHRYGTPRRNLERAAEGGKHAVLDIDVQGARQVRASVPDALLVFVLPPTAEALVGRLAGRGTEGRREFLGRLATAREELLHAPAFDHVVVNEELEGAVERVRALVQGGEVPPGPEEPLDQAVARLRAEIDAVLARTADDPSDGAMVS